MKHKNKLAGLIVASLASLGMVATPLAIAVEAGTTSTVDPNHDVSFTIIKYKGDPVKDGENKDDLEKVEGVKFKVEKVTTTNPLTTNEGWEEVSALTAKTACADTSKCAEIGTITTDGNGSANITNTTNNQFTVGVYKITEQTKTGYTAAAPFLITLPYTKDGTWNYDLTAYPKNQVLIPTKTVKDTGETGDITGTDIGDTITYTLNVPVPADPVGEFKIEDTFPAGLVPTEATLATDPADILLTEDYTAAIEGQKITVTIKPTGQEKLKESRKNNPELKLVLTFKGKVTAFPTADHQFSNQADVTYPNRTEPVKTSSDVNFDPLAENAVPGATLSKYVDVEITKQGNTTDSSADLSGAIFEIYVCDKAADGTLSTKGNPLKASTTATGTDQPTTFTTANADTAAKTAKVTAYNLQDPRFRNGAQLATPVIYCVVETKAPTGFVRDPNPREVAFAADSVTGKVTVINQKETILSNLPLTGATGVYVLLAVGGIMVAVGMLMFLKRRNHDTEE